MKEIVCYHHNDGDGKMAAGVVASVYPHAEFREINYNHPFNFYGLKDKIVIVVDFSFPDMKSLMQECKELIWIDHHESAMKTQELMWINDAIKGKRKIGKCGALLAFEYFYPNEDIPQCIKFVNDYDLWIKELPNTDAFNERISLVDFIGWFNDLVSERDTRPNVIEKIIEEGKTLLLQKKNRVKSSIEKAVDKKFNNKSALWVNSSPMDVSLCGSEILKKGYDIAVMFFHDKDEVIFGLRSNKYDVSEMATKFGGGGHKSAAGFHLQIKDAFELLNTQNQNKENEVGK